MQLRVAYRRAYGSSLSTWSIWRCSAFIAWTGWTLAMTVTESWWQHHKQYPGIIIIIIIIIVTIICSSEIHSWISHWDRPTYMTDLQRLSAVSASCLSDFILSRVSAVCLSDVLACCSSRLVRRRPRSHSDFTEFSISVASLRSFWSCNCISS